MKRDSIPHTLAVTMVAAVACSLLVSSAAVGLRGLQERNKALSKKTSILKAAGLDRPGINVASEFGQRVETRLVDLATGQFVPAAKWDPGRFDQRSAARDPKLSRVLPREKDLAGIGRRENFSLVYLIKDDDRLDQLVLPFHGKGLFSTLYGFLAIDADRNTVRGITFYEHGETPGLGGEVDHPGWTEQWKGKQIFDETGRVRIELVKVRFSEDDAIAPYAIDGLSGATMTSNGVTEMLRFWLGPDGFGPFLQRGELQK